MTNDFLVEILPASDKNLRVRLSADYPELKRKLLLRQLIELEVADLEALRGGNAPEVLVNKVSEKLSRWLLGDDLASYLDVALRPGQKPVRLILDVDEELLAALSDLPVELLYFNTYPLVISNGVNAIIHLLQQGSTAQPSLTSRRPPLRVLLVRSSPKDLKVYVPPAEPLAAYIGGLVEDPNLVRVDVLSSEAPGAPPVTWDSLRKQLEDASYDVLVYLGHGDLLDKVAEDRPAIGVLQLEHADGVHHQPVRSDQLRAHLKEHPVPVVLLTGCLTAAEMDTIADVQLKNRIMSLLPRWMRGIQGVAQALVGGESGVQFAVGMRYKLETTDAVTFLRAFFKSLLNVAPQDQRASPGDAEAAVRAGRTELFAASPMPPSWSAPVIFRAPGKEPTFGFLANYKPSVPPPAGQPAGPDPVEAAKDERDQRRREEIWKALVKQPGLQFARELLDDTEKAVRERALDRHTPMLMPGRVEAESGMRVAVFIRLYGPLSVNALRLKLVVGGSAASFDSLAATAALTERGFELSVESEFGGNEVTLGIRRTAAAQDAPLPEGDLVEAGIVLGQAVAVVYPLGLELLEADPSGVTPVMGSNAVLVQSPLG